MENKYGLNWRVWGNEEKKSPKEKSTPKILEGIGRGWSSSKPKNSQADCEEPVEKIQPSEQKYTVRLKNARFIPDENTDFNKSCKISVEIDSQEPPKGKVTFSLWSCYNGKKSDLQCESQERLQNGIVESQLQLYYDEKYYEDTFFNGKKDLTADYFFKVNAKKAREVESDPLTMPRSSGKISKMIFKDDEGNCLKGVNITLEDGAIYSTNEQGEIEIATQNNADTFTLNSIELPV
jgi:hypothetical protein